MADTSGDSALPSSSSRVSITVLSIKPVNFGRIFALASVEIDIDGVLLVIHGVRRCAQPMGTRVDLPVFRDENGVWQRAITFPDEICGPIGKAVLDEFVARGLAAKGPAFQPGAEEAPAANGSRTSKQKRTKALPDRSQPSLLLPVSGRPENQGTGNCRAGHHREETQEGLNAGRPRT
jgi:hypothetical protein